MLRDRRHDEREDRHARCSGERHPTDRAADELGRKNTSGMSHDDGRTRSKEDPEQDDGDCGDHERGDEPYDELEAEADENIQDHRAPRTELMPPGLHFSTE